MAILSIELLTFTFSLWALMALKKRKFPNLFFPPKGVVVFSPPEEEDLKNVRDYKNQKEKNPSKNKGKPNPKKKPMLPVRLQNATSKVFENIKYMADLELAVMMTYVIILVSAVSYIFQYFAIIPQAYNTPNLSFYLTLSFFAVFIYHLVKMAAVGGLAIYENRLSIIISFLTGILLSVLLLVGRGLIDINFERAFSLQIYQLRSLLGLGDHDLKFVSIDVFLLGFVVLFTIFVYSLVPVIIKYGNSYVGLNKEAYRLEAMAQKEETERLIAASTQQKEEGEQEESAQDNKKSQENDTLSQLKETRKALRWLNAGLVFHLLVTFCWLTPITSTWQTALKDNGFGLEIFRIAFIVLHILTLLFSYKTEIGRYMLRVYDNISSLLSDPSDANLKAVRHKASAHIGYMGVMSYQVVMKIIIPFLLLLLFVNKRLALHYETKDQIKAYYDMNSFSYLDWNCYGLNNPLEIMSQGFMCPADRSFEIVSIENGLGMLSPLSQYKAEGGFAVAKDILKKTQKYGLVHNEFWYSMFSLWTFLYYLVTYILTLIYIFYRKAMEQV